MKKTTPLLLHRPLFTRLLRLPRWGLLFCLAGLLALTSAQAGAPFTFSNTGGLNQARTFPSATLLSNGKVLVAGGQDSAGNILASAMSH